jgi:tRNA pseudouridine38-40 synthase
VEAKDLDRLKLTLAFDGAKFSGWQSQPNHNGIQDHLLEGFARLLRNEDSLQFAVKIEGAGRTDAGVHALGQVAHVDVPKGRLSLQAWRSALNANLPHEIRIMECRTVPSSFHAQQSAKGKVYRYRIWNAAILPPLELGRAWQVGNPLSIGALRSAVALAQGTHDFASFAANRGKPENSTVRSLRRVKVKKRGSLVILEFEGTGFLYRMVRLLTGSLVEIGRGRKDETWFKSLLDKPGNPKTNYLAPAHGLYLAKVIY